MGKNNLSGAWGEAIAAQYLQKKRYKIVATGYRSRFGEIDLIASNRKYLVFVEVKYRKTSLFGLPREAVDFKKQQKLRLVATSYINRYGLQEKTCRFDVLEILDKEITLIKDCF